LKITHQREIAVTKIPIELEEPKIVTTTHAKVIKAIFDKANSLDYSLLIPIEWEE
jgi:hypothetical protein